MQRRCNLLLLNGHSGDLDMMVNPSVSVEMAVLGGDGTSGTSSSSTGNGEVKVDGTSSTSTDNGEVKVDEEWKGIKPSPLASLPSEPPARAKYKKKKREDQLHYRE